MQLCLFDVCLLAAIFALRLEIEVGAGAKIADCSRSDTPAQIVCENPRLLDVRRSRTQFVGNVDQRVGTLVQDVGCGL